MIKSISSNRMIARIVGVVFLVGMVVGIGGNVLILSLLTPPDYLSTITSNSMLLGLGALMWLLAVGGDVAHGVLMFPILKQHSERIAIGYLATRIVDAMFIAIMVLFILVQLPIGSEYLKAADTAYLQGLSTISTEASLYAYNFAMTSLGVAGFIAIWGMVGYIIIFGGSILEILGFDLLSIHTIPGGLWELFIGVWLIVKGFKVVPDSAK